MSYAQSVPSETIVIASSSSDHRGRWRILAAIVGALHHSRRLQAERILHQHRHLIHRTNDHVILGPNPRDAGEN